MRHSAPIWTMECVVNPNRSHENVFKRCFHRCLLRTGWVFWLNSYGKTYGLRTDLKSVWRTTPDWHQQVTAYVPIGLWKLYFHPLTRFRIHKESVKLLRTQLAKRRVCFVCLWSDCTNTLTNTTVCEMSSTLILRSDPLPKSAQFITITQSHFDACAGASFRVI